MSCEKKTNTNISKGNICKNKLKIITEIVGNLKKFYLN